MLIQAALLNDHRGLLHDLQAMVPLEVHVLMVLWSGDREPADELREPAHVPLKI
jgi:hypothetical protein